MMNIFDYEPIRETINENATWLSLKIKYLFSREIRYTKFYTFGTKTDNYKTLCYLICTNIPPIDRVYYKMPKDKKGIKYVDLNPVWEKLGFEHLKKDRRIYLNVEEEDDETIIYTLQL